MTVAMEMGFCTLAIIADGLSRVCELAAHNYKVSDVNEPFSCSSCFKYKIDLEEMAEELITARKIIQLLQEDLNNYKDVTPPSTSDERSKSHMNSKRTNNWEIVTVKHRKYTRVIHDQLPITVIPITNRYNALHNLQNDIELPSNPQNCHTKKNVPSKQNKTTSSQKRR
jgi:hypothetical protein